MDASETSCLLLFLGAAILFGIFLGFFAGSLKPTVKLTAWALEDSPDDEQPDDEQPGSMMASAPRQDLDSSGGSVC